MDLLIFRQWVRPQGAAPDHGHGRGEGEGTARLRPIPFDTIYFHAPAALSSTHDKLLTVSLLYP